MTTLVIDNEEVIRLVRSLSKLEGKSESEVIRESVQAMLATHTSSQGRSRQPGELAARLLEIGRSTAPLWDESNLSITHGDLLYDDDGLPK